MTGTSWLAISTGVLALLASPATVCAQPQVGSFAELSAFAGERVEVRRVKGPTVTGRLRVASDTSLVLDANDGRTIQLEAGRVREISRQEKDSVRDGLVLGCVLGAGIGAAIGALANADASEPVGAYTSIFGALIGLGVGAAGDAASHKRVVIFRGPASQAAFAPILTKGRRGLAVNLSF